MTNPAKYFYAMGIEEGNKESQFDTFYFNFIGHKNIKRTELCKKL